MEEYYVYAVYLMVAHGWTYMRHVGGDTMVGRREILGEIPGGRYLVGEIGRESGMVALAWRYEKGDTMTWEQPLERTRGLGNRALKWERTGRSRAGMSK